MPGAIARPAWFRFPHEQLYPHKTHIVWHYTAGFSFDSAVRTLSQNSRAPVDARKVSAHFVISPDGHVAQLADLDETTWHAGPTVPSHANEWGIGVEMVYPGWREFWTNQKRPRPLTRGQLDERWPAGWHPPLAEDGKTWAVWPEPLLAAAEAVTEFIIRECFPYVTPASQLGHSELRRHKSDPGPRFPLERMVAAAHAEWYADPDTLDGFNNDAPDYDMQVTGLERAKQLHGRLRG